MIKYNWFYQNSNVYASFRMICQEQNCLQKNIKTQPIISQHFQNATQNQNLAGLLWVRITSIKNTTRKSLRCFKYC